ncbi:TPA: 4Fe-4S binding protein [bacterium]|nr:4Fe-4S binding protein [bacterium]
MNKKRQLIRRALILISFLLFPITIFYFSPYLIIMGASEGIVSGSFIMFSSMFVLSLFFGRLFCGWACPAGGLGECAFMANLKQAKGGKADWIKYFIWVPWIALIIIMFIISGGIHAIEPLYQTKDGTIFLGKDTIMHYPKYGISISEPWTYMIYFIIVALVIILSLATGKRGFCHYVCWMAPFMIIGTKISNLIRLPALRLKSDKDKCVKCKACTKNCPMSLEVMDMVQSGSMKNSECILCGTCADVCPKGVIKYRM